MSNQRFRNTVLNSLRNLDDRLYEGAQPLRILFVNTGSYGFSCQAPVIRSLRKIDGVYIRVTTDKACPLDPLEFANLEEDALFHEFYISTYAAILSKWHLIVDTHKNGFYPKRRALRIGMHHGPGFGILGSKIHLVQQYDIFFGLSSAERFYLEEIQPEVFNTNRAFFSVGFPKTDALINHKGANSKKLRSSLKLEDRPNILITSHWQSTSTLCTFGSLPFKSLAKAFPQYNIIQTGHPWLWKEDKEIDGLCRKTLFDDLKDVEKQYQNAYFLPHENAEELLTIADLLVADHSSIMTSYCLLDRPIVWFDNAEVQFAIPAIRETYRQASNTFQKVDELPDACQRAMKDPDAHSTGRQFMKKLFTRIPEMPGKKQRRFFAP